jgi:multicomponent Na+:H+ antiporter subunit G
MGDAVTWAALADVLASALFLAGSVLTLVAAVGLVRFPDLLARMHAGTKPQVLGLVAMVVGLAIHVRSPRIAGPLLLVLIFQVVTAPVAAHMVGRAGYRTGRIRHELLVRDELTDDLEAAHRLAAERGARRPRPPVDDGR